MIIVLCISLIASLVILYLSLRITAVQYSLRQFVWVYMLSSIMNVWFYFLTKYLEEFITGEYILFLVYFIILFLQCVFLYIVFRIMKISIQKITFFKILGIQIWLTAVLGVCVSMFSILVNNGGSMQPTYSPKDMLIANKLSYILTAPDHGDVIVFQMGDTSRWVSVKRIIGVPWDTLRFEDGVVMRKKSWESEFQMLDEGYLSESNKNNTYMPAYIEGVSEFAIPTWSYWVMGDNRQNSSDSRQCFRMCTWVGKEWHFLDASQIVWRVIFWLDGPTMHE